MKRQVGTAAAVCIFLAVAFAPGARAQCGITPESFRLAVPLPNVAAAQALPNTTTAGTVQDSAQGDRSIVGFWKVTFTSGGQVIDLGYALWHSDQTEILSDTAAGPAHGNVCMGAWAKTGLRTYKLNHQGLSFDLNGNLSGTVLIKEQVTVARDGNTYRGAFSTDFVDLSGNIFMHLDGEVAGTRITAD
ncbi:MAG TPA: hypothetical protein VGK64_16795 [Bryobacteraceae bacterium]